MISPLSLVSPISEENSADNLSYDSSNIVSPISFADFSFLFVLVFDGWMTMCLSVSAFEFILLGVHWASWIWCSCLRQTGRFEPIFPQILSLSLSLPLLLLGLLHHACKFCRLCSLFFNLFSFCSLDSIICIVLSPTSQVISSVCSNLLLNSSSDVSILVILFFSSTISFWILPWVSLYRYFHFIQTLFSWLL